MDEFIELVNERIKERMVEDKLEDIRFQSDKHIVPSSEFSELINSVNRFQNFWDAESENWDKRLGDDVKTLIGKEISCLNGRVLNIGAGSNNYTESKTMVCVDYSRQMLLKNRSNMKVQYDLNYGLPFCAGAFDNAIAVFSLNYLENLDDIIIDLKSVLKEKGEVVVFQTDLNNWYQNQSRHTYSEIKVKLAKHFNIIKEQVLSGVKIMRCVNGKRT